MPLKCMRAGCTPILGNHHSHLQIFQLFLNCRAISTIGRVAPGHHRSIPQDGHEGPVRGVHQADIPELLLDLGTIATALLELACVRFATEGKGMNMEETGDIDDLSGFNDSETHWYTNKIMSSFFPREHHRTGVPIFFCWMSLNK